MPGTYQGWLKARETMIKKMGGIEAFKQATRERGAKGGKAQVPKGFAIMPYEKRSAAGQKGGERSKRRPSNGQ